MRLGARVENKTVPRGSSLERARGNICGSNNCGRRDRHKTRLSLRVVTHKKQRLSAASACRFQRPQRGATSESCSLVQKSVDSPTA